jgi:hypothetical protein
MRLETRRRFQSSAFGGTPLPPPWSIGIIELAKNSSQNLERVRLRGKILIAIGLGGKIEKSAYLMDFPPAKYSGIKTYM